MDIKTTPKFSMADIESNFNVAERDFEQSQIEVFKDVLDSFTAEARQRGEYNNHTYNLRSSIGGEVLKDGKHVYRNFEQVGDGEKGVRDAKRLVRKLRRSYSKGIVLLVVTAEGYAAKVESMGKDVLTGSSRNAVTELKRLLQ